MMADSEFPVSQISPGGCNAVGAYLLTTGPVSPPPPFAHPK